jgi:hypothetical protein
MLQQGPRLGRIESQVVPGQRALVERETSERGRRCGPAAKDDGAAGRHLRERDAEQALCGGVGANLVDIIHHQHEGLGQTRVEIAEKASGEGAELAQVFRGEGGQGRHAGGIL